MVLATLYESTLAVTKFAVYYGTIPAILFLGVLCTSNELTPFRLECSSGSPSLLVLVNAN